MKRTYGNLVLDVPAGHEEEILVVLRSSSSPAGGGGEPTAAATAPTLVVKRIGLPADAPPLEALAEAEVHMLRASVGEVEIVGRTEATIGGQRTIVQEVVFATPSGRMRQAHLAQIAAGRLSVFVATAGDDEAFTATRERLVRLADGAQVSS
jgi:hypothetical protein